MGGWHGWGFPYVVALLLMAGMAVSCGAGDPTDTATGGETANGEEQDGGDTDAETLSWVPFGPSDPDIPTPSWPVYNAFADGDCAALERATDQNDVGEFGRGMVAVCFAAVEGQQERWDEVAETAGADPSTLANDCLARLVSDLIDRAREWHERNPGQTPDVQFVRVAGQTKCGAQSAGQNDPNGDTEPDFTDEPEPTAPEVSSQAARRARGVPA